MNDIYLTNKQYVEALERLKSIVKTEKLYYYDDTTPGDKNTECSWGLCWESLKLWPTKDLHLFPKDFPKRSSPKYTKQYHTCPNDYDPNNENGCFYHCKFFQKRATGWGKQEILDRIEELLTDFKKNHKV